MKLARNVRDHQGQKNVWATQYDALASTNAASENVIQSAIPTVKYSHAHTGTGHGGFPHSGSMSRLRTQTKIAHATLANMTFNQNESCR